MHALNNLNFHRPPTGACDGHFFFVMEDIRMCSCSSFCFVSRGLCQVHLMYTNVAFKGHWTLVKICFYCFRKYVQFLSSPRRLQQQQQLGSLKSFHAAFIVPHSVKFFFTKRYYSFMKPHLFCAIFSLFLPHILMSGVWFCIFLLVNCLQVQYADANSSTSISKCNISTYSAESKLYCTV